MGVGADDVSDVDDDAGHDVVPAVTVEKPVPVALAELGKWLTRDQSERQNKIVDSAGAVTLSTPPETPEKVEVAQHASSL
jgi:hypothetical protein